MQKPVDHGDCRHAIDLS